MLRIAGHGLAGGGDQCRAAQSPGFVDSVGEQRALSAASPELGVGGAEVELGGSVADKQGPRTHRPVTVEAHLDMPVAETHQAPEPVLGALHQVETLSRDTGEIGSVFGRYGANA